MPKKKTLLQVIELAERGEYVSSGSEDESTEKSSKAFGVRGAKSLEVIPESRVVSPPTPGSQSLQNRASSREKKPKMSGHQHLSLDGQKHDRDDDNKSISSTSSKGKKKHTFGLHFGKKKSDSSQSVTSSSISSEGSGDEHGDGKKKKKRSKAKRMASEAKEGIKKIFKRKKKKKKGSGSSSSESESSSDEEHKGQKTTTATLVKSGSYEQQGSGSVEVGATSGVVQPEITIKKTGINISIDSHKSDKAVLDNSAEGQVDLSGSVEPEFATQRSQHVYVKTPNLDDTQFYIEIDVDGAAEQYLTRSGKEDVSNVDTVSEGSDDHGGEGSTYLEGESSRFGGAGIDVIASTPLVSGDRLTNGHHFAVDSSGDNGEMYTSCDQDTASISAHLEQNAGVHHSLEVGIGGSIGEADHDTIALIGDGKEDAHQNPGTMLTSSEMKKQVAKEKTTSGVPWSKKEEGDDEKTDGATRCCFCWCF